MKRGQSIGLEVNLAYRQVDGAVSGIGRCKTRPCFAKKGRAIKQAADRSLARITNFSGPLRPACLRGLVATARAYLAAWSKYGAASMRLDAGVMEAQAKLAKRLYLRLLPEVKSCATP